MAKKPKVSLYWRARSTRKSSKVSLDENYPEGTIYQLRWEHHWKTIDPQPRNVMEAIAAKQEFEARLARGEFPQPKPQPPPKPSRPRLDDAIEAYLEKINRPNRNGDRRSKKSINSKRSELKRFATWSQKTWLDEINADLLIAWRDELNQKYEADTVINKLMHVVTFCKHNPLAPMPSPLPHAEVPSKKKTVPDPFTEDEFNRMMSHADYESALAVYFFAVTGMRHSEVAHASKEQINWETGEIGITKQTGFHGKTDAALRWVPLPDDLLAELKLKKDGLLFPAAEGGVQCHFDRQVIEPLARLAGVMATTEKPHMQMAGMIKNDWCHRFRDTKITNGLHECKSSADIMTLCERVGHADMETLKKYFGKLKAPYVPKFPEHLKKAKDVLEMRKVS